MSYLEVLPQGEVQVSQFGAIRCFSFLINSKDSAVGFVKAFKIIKSVFGVFLLFPVAPTHSFSFSPIYMILLYLKEICG